MFEIEIMPEAESDLLRMPRFHAVAIMHMIRQTLLHEPVETNRSRIKLLKYVEPPTYRLRVGDWRVVYRVETGAAMVRVLRVLAKEETEKYYEELQP